MGGIPMRRDPFRRATGPADNSGQPFCIIAAFDSKLRFPDPVGESPTATGGSPVPPSGFGRECEMTGLAAATDDLALRQEDKSGMV